MIKKILCLLLLVNTAYAQQVDTVYTDTTITIAFINNCEGRLDIPDAIKQQIKSSDYEVNIQSIHKGECIVDNHLYKCLRIYKATVVIRAYKTEPKRKTNEN